MVKKRMGGHHDGIEKLEKVQDKFQEKQLDAKLGWQMDKMLFKGVEQMAEASAETQAEQNKFKINLVSRLHNHETPWAERQEIFNKATADWNGRGWGSTIPFDCPANFGPFVVSRWGGTGGCGFDVWFNDENGTRSKRWIDLDEIYNLVKDVRDGWSQDSVRGPQIANMAQEKRTPACLAEIFPNGYYISENSMEPVVSAPTSVPQEVPPIAQGGAYRKRTRNRKNKSNKRKTKKINKRKTRKSKK